MSTRLALVPLGSWSDLQKTEILAGGNSKTVLALGRDYRVYVQLTDMSHRRPTEPEIPERPTVRSRPLPAHLRVTAGEDTDIAHDSDHELTVASADEIVAKLRLPDGGSTNDRAVLAFLRELGNAPVIIWVH